MQRKYELMVVLRPDFGVEEKAIKDLFTKLIAGRNIADLKILGKKKLAYPIKKQTEGVYAVATFTGEPVRVVELEKLAKQDQTILRYLCLAAV